MRSIKKHNIIERKREPVMRKYILIANRQKDIEFQYADFLHEKNMNLLFFDYTKLRIGLLKIIEKLMLKNTRINYYLVFHSIFKKTIDYHLNYSEDHEYVFIIMARAYEKYGKYLVKHLEKKYPLCKVVLYLADLIHNMRFSLDEAKKEFDIICSFDENEAKNEGLHFVLEPFSTRYLSVLPKIEEPEFDVSFVGSAKGRYNRIIWLYNELTKKGLKCNFYIAGVEKKDQVVTDGIHYEGLDFEKVLLSVTNSKCVVEIMQKEGYSATTRYAEAMLLNRNLITDCPALQYALEKNIILFDENSDLSLSEICAKNDIDIEKYIEKFSINSFVHTIDQYLI